MKVAYDVAADDHARGTGGNDALEQLQHLELDRHPIHLEPAGNQSRELCRLLGVGVLRHTDQGGDVSGVRNVGVVLGDAL